MAFVRVKGPDGAEFTVDEGAVPGMGPTVSVLDKEAVDGNGRPLPPKYDIHKGGALPVKTSTREVLETYAVDHGGMTVDQAKAYGTKAELHAALEAAASADPTPVADSDETGTDPSQEG